uniref:Family with sequence similarity 32 member A n=1 Tax=Oncorhynchus mykiss TaxID=8022 RepID=A0A8K9UHV9_ONCMY
QSSSWCRLANSSLTTLHLLALFYYFRKKKKNKEKKHRLEQQINTNKNEEEETKSGYIDKRTPAQMAFVKMQEKRQMERILNKAEKTHKRRVEDFNHHLDTLTEHYDIPKVSWTK